jgi:acyl-coenzyme A thioesterase PaaI-like protein
MSDHEDALALQDLYTPTNRCFGCGPASEYGLRLKSRIDGDRVVSSWQPDERYESVYGLLSGGIISSLLECQANWATGVALMEREKLDAVPANFLTKEITVQFRAPTPITPGKPLELSSRLIEDNGRLMIAESEIHADSVLCARATVTSVVVDDGSVAGRTRDQPSPAGPSETHSADANAETEGAGE